MKKEEQIKKEVHILYSKLIEKRPSHFSNRDIANAFFGSLLVGVAFVLKGAVMKTSELFTPINLIAIILTTILVLTAQIYFIGYTRVVRKKQRKFGQFWFKRIITLYAITLITSIALMFMYGLNHMIETNMQLLNFLIALSFPCAVGAAIPSLMKQF